MERKKNPRLCTVYFLDGRFKLLIPFLSCFLAVWGIVPGEALQACTAVAAAMKPACLTEGKLKAATDTWNDIAKKLGSQLSGANSTEPRSVTELVRHFPKIPLHLNYYLF